MFEYLVNEYNRRPALVLGAADRPAGRLVADIPYSESLRFTVPGSPADLRALQNKKYWADHHRRTRRMTEDHGPLRFSVVTDAEALGEKLPAVQRLFAMRWAAEYTSSPWISPAGFQPYAEAMIALAEQGRAELIALEVGDQLLSFAYCLVEDETYYFFQHAATPDVRFRRYGPGMLLVAMLIEDLTTRPRARTFDFMTGTAAYKRQWATVVLPISYRIEECRGPVGCARFAVRWIYRRTRIYVQVGNPTLRSLAKAVLRRLVQARTRLSSRPAPPEPSRTPGTPRLRR